MANDLKHSVRFEDEIDFLQLIKILFDSKKLIISTILIFTIASIIYSLSLKPSFNTSAKLEIGYLEFNNGDRELIESPSDLISDLKILLLKNPDGKFSQEVVMNSLEGKIINLETTSRSAEQNENLLIEIINYIDERHDILSKSIDDKKKKKIMREIEGVKAEIAYFQKKLSDPIQSQYMNIIKNLDKETESRELINLFTRNANYMDVVFGLNQKLLVLNENLEMLNSKIYSKTQPIGTIATETIKPKTLLTILLGIILGFINGILLTFIIYSIKSFKESKA